MVTEVESKLQHPHSVSDSIITTDMDKLPLLVRLTRAFSALLELEELVPCILAKIKEVIQVESCAILLLDEEKKELYFPMISDVSAEIEERLKNIRFPADQGISGWVLQRGIPVLIPDVTRDKRFLPDVDRLTGVRTRDLLCAPLLTRHGAMGVIGLRNKRVGTFTEEDLAFLDALAGPIAVAMENACLYQHARQSEARLKTEIAALQMEIDYRRRFDEIIGASSAMAGVFSLMESAILSPSTVLLDGETGTGKDLMARAIHYHGKRKGRPFVTVNCGSLSETLLQSELFGHKKGAFTGADVDKQGLFEAANGGTIFLDEIGETTPAVQVSLLRVLQEGEIRRVGETKPRQIDARVISATNCNLEQQVLRQRFRKDLYYRISVFPIRVPALRERREDIPLLVSHFIRLSNQKLGKQIPGITQKGLEFLVHYAWPGNVRELKNEIERASMLTQDGERISSKRLSERIVTKGSLRAPLPAGERTLKRACLTFEREYIGELLRQNQGNAAKTAKMLGISRQMMHKKIKQYGLRSM
jgi:Nif-specific regulatory protein